MTICRRCGQPMGTIPGVDLAWCSACLAAKVLAARAALDPCHCSQVAGPHRHEGAE